MHKLKKTLLSYNNLDVEWLKSSPIVNDAYPGKFNLSFIEKYMLDKYGNYINLKQNNKISKLQNVIRINDYNRIIESLKLNNEFKNTHLSAFKMLGTVFFSNSNDKNKYLYELIVEKLFAIIEEYKLDTQKLYIKICRGGNVKELTKNKYTFSYEVPADSLSEKIFSNKRVNLIYDNTRETFLSLNLFQRLTPWGYRVEVSYKVKNDLIELATLEYFVWEPIKNKEGKIKDLKKFNRGLVLMVLGFERLKFILNRDHRTIVDINEIHQDLSFVKSHSNLTDNEARIVFESLKCLILIYNENNYTELRGHKKDRVRDIEKSFFPIIKGSIKKNELKKIIKKIIHTENSIQTRFGNEFNLIQFPEVIFTRIFKRLKKFINEKY